MFRAGIIIATIAIGAAWALARVNRDIDAVFGDVAFLNPEMLAAPGTNDRAGEGRVGPSAAETRTSDGSHFHRGESV